MSVLTVKYRNTYGDLIAYQLYHYPRMPAVWFGIGLWMVLIAWILLNAPSSVPLWGKVLVIVFIEAGILCAFVVLTAVSTFLVFRPKANRGIFTDHRITLTDQALIEETEVGRSEHAWHGIVKIRQSRNHIFVYATQHAAHVIPKRAFASPTESDAMFAELVRRWKAAKEPELTASAP